MLCSAVKRGPFLSIAHECNEHPKRDRWWSRVKLHYLFSSLSSLSWWHKHVSPFAMSDFLNEKKSVLERTWLQKVIETVHQSGALLLPCVALGPLFYSNVFNSKSNVTVTLSEDVDGNFQARCGQRLQSTNHVILRATISPWLVRREA
jgi:hypothetical protein